MPESDPPNAEWEPVTRDGMTHRLPVTDGWLYRTFAMRYAPSVDLAALAGAHYEEAGVALCFVLDPNAPHVALQRAKQ